MLTTVPTVSIVDQVHGFPKVMGVLTHLDGFKDQTKLKKTKKALKHRFWAEIYQGKFVLGLFDNKEVETIGPLALGGKSTQEVA